MMEAFNIVPQPDKFYNVARKPFRKEVPLEELVFPSVLETLKLPSLS
jgi:hypothetical protein